MKSFIGYLSKPKCLDILTNSFQEYQISFNYEYVEWFPLEQQCLELYKNRKRLSQTKPHLHEE